MMALPQDNLRWDFQGLLLVAKDKANRMSTVGREFWLQNFLFQGAVRDVSFAARLPLDPKLTVPNWLIYMSVDNLNHHLNHLSSTLVDLSSTS